MKLATAFLVVILVLSAAASAEAQNGRGYRNGGQNRSAYCPRLDASYPVQQFSADEAARLLFYERGRKACAGRLPVSLPNMELEDFRQHRCR